MFRNLRSELAVSQREEPFLEYSSLCRMGDLALGWVFLEPMRLLPASLAARVVC